MMWSEIFFPMHARLIAAGVEWSRAVEIAAAYAWRMLRCAPPQTDDPPYPIFATRVTIS